MIKWTLRIFLVPVFLIGGLVGTILLIEPKLDLSPWRQQIATQLTRLAGRELALDGELTLALGRQVRFEIGDLRIANAEWAGPEPLFRAARLAAGLDVLSLFHGVLHINEVVLRDARAVLVTSGDGEQNWQIAGDEETDRSEHDRGDGWRLLVERVVAEDLAMVYLDQADGQSFEAYLDRVDQRNEFGMLVLDAIGRANDLDIQIEGQFGLIESMLENRDIDVDLRADLNDAVVTLSGRFGDPVRLEDIEIEAAIHGPDIASLLGALGVDSQAAGDIDLQLRVSDLENGFAWQSTGHLGPFNLESQGAIERPLELDGLQFTVDLNGEDLSALGPLVGVRALPAQPYRLHGDILRDSQGLELRDISIETGKTTLKLAGKLPLFPAFDDGNTQLEIYVPEPDQFAGLIGTDVKAIGPLRVTASLAAQDSGEELLDASIEIGKNTLTLKGPLGSFPGYRNTRLVFGFAGPNLAMLTAAAGLTGMPDGAYHLAGTLQVQDDGALMLQLDEGRAGKLRLKASGSLGRLPDFDAAELAVTLGGKSLHEAVGGVAGTALPHQPFEFTARFSGDLTSPGFDQMSARLGDASLELKGRIGMPPRFRDTDALIELRVPEIGQLLPNFPDAPWKRGNYRLAGRLRSDPDALHLRNIAVEGGGLELALEARVPLSFEPDGVQLVFDASGPDLAAVLPASMNYRPPHAPFAAEVRLVTQRGRLELEKLAVRLADAQMTGHGSMALGDLDAEDRLTFDARGPHLSSLGLIGKLQFPDEAFSIRGELRRAAGKIEISELLANLGVGEISGQISLERGDRQRVTVIARAKSFDFSRFASVRGTTQKDKQNGSRLISDDALPLDFLDALDGNFQVTGEALLYPDPKFPGKVLVRDLELDATLENGSLRLNTFRVVGDRGQVSVNGALRRSAEGVVAKGSLVAKNFHFGILAAGEGLEQLPTHVLDMNISARGKSLRELAASLNGDIHLAGGEGRTVNAGLDKALGSFLDELVSVVNPFRKQEAHTAIVCTAAAIELVNGVMQMNPGFVIRTDKVDISASGTIDLSTEAIDVQFRNSPRKGIGLSAGGLVKPFIKVGGSLAKPGIRLNTSNALLSGTAAVATGGLSLLVTGLIDRASTASNPCLQVVAAAEKRKQQLRGSRLKD